MSLLSEETKVTMLLLQKAKFLISFAIGQRKKFSVNDVNNKAAAHYIEQMDIYIANLEDAIDKFDRYM